MGTKLGEGFNFFILASLKYILTDNFKSVPAKYYNQIHKVKIHKEAYALITEISLTTFDENLSQVCYTFLCHFKQVQKNVT